MVQKTAVTKSLLALAAFLAIGAGAGLTALASAQTTGTTSTVYTTSTKTHVMGNRQMGQGVFGTVSAVNGTTITLTSKGFGANATETTYTVDASSAKFEKSVSGAKPTTATISDIAVGDTVGIRGTVTGTSVVATDVTDGLMMRGGPGGFGGKGHGVMGTVSAVNGNTVTVTGKDGTSYTIDASGAKVSKTIDIAVSGIAVGDTVGVEGTVSGTNVTAAHIMDGVPAKAQAPPTQTQ